VRAIGWLLCAGRAAYHNPRREPRTRAAWPSSSHCSAGAPTSSAPPASTNCFIETGFGKALLIDFNYATEPLAGHYPGRLGLPLLRQSRLNHLGKLVFQQFYWHSLLPGRDVPGISSTMPARGKTRTPAQAATGARGHR